MIMETDSHQYWSQGKACFVPSALGDHIVIPPNEYNWLIDQSDEALDDTINLNNELQAEATIGEPFMLHAPIVRDIVTRELSRKLAALTTEMFDELKTAIDEQWGMDTNNWKEVNPNSTLLQIVARGSNRVFVGFPLCRDQKFIHSCLSYASTLFPCSIAIRHVPKPLQPLFTPLITIANQRHRRTIAKFVKPEVQRRMAELSGHGPDAEKALKNSRSTENCLNWLIDAALKSGRAFDRDPYIITQRLIILQFVTMYPISGSSTDALYDIVSQPNSEAIVASIRQNINEVLSTNDNTWTKRALSQLTTLDSAFRESLRLAPVVAFGSGRYVGAKGGLTTPISNTYLPEGSTVAIPSVAIHENPANYDNPTEYDAFRFNSKVEQTSSTETVNPEALNNTSPDATVKPTAFANTSFKFTSFGHGRSACPGRFFASDQMKLIFAYIIQNYDIEFLPKRPDRMWAGPFNVAPMTKTIRVKRREKA